MNKTEEKIIDTNVSKLLLDTHILIWYAEGLKLSQSQVKAIDKARNSNSLLFSPISIWEITMLVDKKRISLSLPLEQWISKLTGLTGLSSIDLSIEILIESCKLPNYPHKDPVDRMILSTARFSGASLITMDQKMVDYGNKGYVKILQT